MRALAKGMEWIFHILTSSWSVVGRLLTATCFRSHLSNVCIFNRHTYIKWQLFVIEIISSFIVVPHLCRRIVQNYSINVRENEKQYQRVLITSHNRITVLERNKISSNHILCIVFATNTEGIS